MFIYVCGPYSPPAEENDPDRRKQIIGDNIKKANQVAVDIAMKGHFPFTPHTMMHGWEDVYGVGRDIVMRNCYEWLEKCDALYFIGQSPGANMEYEKARELNKSRDEKHRIRFFDSIEEIPDENAGATEEPPFKGEMVLSGQIP
jgi:hypothetical protein